MIKRLLLCLSLVAAWTMAQAQSEGWYKYPIFSDCVTDIIETSDKVYYLSGTNLFSFSPADQENYSYSALNKLSDSNVAQLHYNYDSDYLLVVYDNCNIDILTSDGKTINLPEIRDAQIQGAKAINGVAFGEGRIAIAASFGMVIYREDKWEVVESGIYNTPVDAIAIMDGNLLVYANGDNGKQLSFSPLSERHNTLAKYKKLDCDLVIGEMAPIDNKTLLTRNKATGAVHMMTVNFGNATCSAPIKGDASAWAPFRRFDGGWYSANSNNVVLIRDGKVFAALMPEGLRGQKYAIHSGSDKVWAGNGDGIGRYDVSSSTPTVLFDKMLPAFTTTCGKVGYMKYSPDGERLYISNIETSVYKSAARGECVDQYQTTNVIEQGHPRDVSLKVASAGHTMSQKWQQANGNKRMYGDPAWIVEDPADPNRYYCANNHEGLYVICFNPSSGEYEEVGKFDTSNSPVPDNWGPRVQDVNIDPQGNLWIGYQKGTRYAVLPAGKRQMDPKSISVADWKQHDGLRNIDLDQKDMMSLFCQKSNMMFVLSGKDSGGFVAIDTRGTYDDPSDDAVYHWRQFVDQDGNSFPTPTRISFAVEDARGCVWIGTSAGVFEIPVPSNATNGAMTVRRIKVPRNDGTNFADYLLESDQINWIALDPTDRKWIATENSGIFLVSQTGDQILKNYHKDNSPLLSNVVCSIECSRDDNTVYVGTAEGLFSFLSDSAPAMDDYSAVNVYPNPVRPEYYGDVTIEGLMENSVVKIADASGNVVHQTRSEGGMATWNACGPTGDRVRSGVYYIYVSSNNGSAAGAVAKVMVIN